MYTQAMGRKFWLEFDQHFKFKALENGLFDKYAEMGGYSAAANEWTTSRVSGTFPTTFEQYVDGVKEVMAFVAVEQRIYFDRFLGNDMENTKLAFQDFAFGVLASPDDPIRGVSEPVHMMNGSRFAQDYLSWHGFIEGAIVLGIDDDFWKGLRWINGMAWELQAKAAPQERFPNANEPLPQIVTAAITSKWQDRSEEELRTEFDNYSTRPAEWMIG